MAGRIVTGEREESEKDSIKGLSLRIRRVGRSFSEKGGGRKKRGGFFSQKKTPSRPERSPLKIEEKAWEGKSVSNWRVDQE